ncbi:uncharacterized protein EDB91DRAFT_1117333 [Suillus paluster]|uniref:uncharacterized protein n=1 Tax=Suillus paluster TaxID=48578 RepID=UPI001B862523|nr:uncharacterized protein EDB91DRAFT_1117333 [Suillus paluster]KAG1746517.1 hypothetical protein EDB91DRAFT_1117333 [Suillus paluster]
MNILGRGWEAAKCEYNRDYTLSTAILDRPSHIGESFWNKVIQISLNTDEAFHRAMELYPSAKITEFKESVGTVTSTAIALHQVVLAAAEQSGRPLDMSIFEDSVDILFEELKEVFPPPEQAPGHENRTVMFSTVLDRMEEKFLQVAIVHGGNEELLTSYTSSLKFSVQHIAVTMGDLIEQHPNLANTLLIAAMAPLLPEIAAVFLPRGGGSWILRRVLLKVGFGPQGPMKGSVAAWLHSWLGPFIPKGSWFSVLQRLAMKG